MKYQTTAEHQSRVPNEICSDKLFAYWPVSGLMNQYPHCECEGEAECPHRQDGEVCILVGMEEFVEPWKSEPTPKKKKKGGKR